MLTQKFFVRRSTLGVVVSMEDLVWVQKKRLTNQTKYQLANRFVTYVVVLTQRCLLQVNFFICVQNNLNNFLSILVRKMTSFRKYFCALGLELGISENTFKCFSIKRLFGQMY